LPASVTAASLAAASTTPASAVVLASARPASLALPKACPQAPAARRGRRDSWPDHFGRTSSTSMGSSNSMSSSGATAPPAHEVTAAWNSKSAMAAAPAVPAHWEAACSRPQVYHCCNACAVSADQRSRHHAVVVRQRRAAHPLHDSQCRTKGAQMPSQSVQASSLPRRAAAVRQPLKSKDEDPINLGAPAARVRVLQAHLRTSVTPNQVTLWRSASVAAASCVRGRRSAMIWGGALPDRGHHGRRGRHLGAREKPAVGWPRPRRQPTWS
jgi:hypothetical protein